MTASKGQAMGQEFDRIGTNRLTDMEIAAEFAYRDMERLGNVLGELRGRGLPAIALMDKYLVHLELMRNIQPNLNPEHMVKLTGFIDYRHALTGTKTLEDLLHDVRSAYESGQDNIEIHGIRSLHTQHLDHDSMVATGCWSGDENRYGEMPASGKAALAELPVPSVRREPDRPIDWSKLVKVPRQLTETEVQVTQLAKNPRVSTNATMLIHLLENRGLFSLLEHEGLFNLLLRRIAKLDEVKNVDYMEDEPVLFVKLSSTYQALQNEFKTGKVPPCELPEFLDDLFMEYAKTEPRWQDGPGCYGPVWKGSVLESEGVAPREVFRPGSSQNVISRYVGMEPFAPEHHVHDSNSALHDAINHGIATELNLIAAKAWHDLNGKTELTKDQIKSRVQKFLDSLGTEEEIIAKMARILHEQEHPTESFAPTAQKSPMAEKFNSIVKGTEAVVPELLREVINELGMLRRELKSPPGVKWGLDSFLCEPGIAAAHRGNSITVSLPRGGMDTIESVESKLTEGSLGVYELLVNGKPGRLMIDLSAYPANEAHAMFHDFRKAWGAYCDRKTMEEQKLGREE
ncbi:hypothetical protein D3C81_350380 [compost metagenome]